MDGFGVAGLMAVLVGALALPLLFTPYLVWSYRRGVTGAGHAALAAAAVVYSMTLWTYTILPLPETGELICDGTLRAVFVPFHTAGEIRWGAGPGGLLHDRALWQVLLNVALFVPFGVFVRHLLGWSPWRTVVAGLVTSSLVELTQVTGNWFIYPCAYRLFDTDDLLANTAGAALGVLAAPLARYVPGQVVRSPDEPTPVRAPRRLLSSAVDLLSVVLTSTAILLAERAALLATGRDPELADPWVQAAVPLVVGVGFLAVVPRVWGTTIGLRTVFLRATLPGGGRPGPGRWARRAASGVGAYVVLDALATASGLTVLETLGRAWVVASALVVLLRDVRGISGYASGLVVVDSRAVPGRAAADVGVDPRRMGSAVLALGGTVYLAGAVLVAVSSVAPGVGLGVALLAVAAMVAASLVLVGYLLVTGVVVVRREGRSLGNLLALLAVLGVTVLVALLVVAVVTRWPWVAALAVGGLSVTGYLGFLFAAFLAYGQLYARRPVPPDVDAVVVLGSHVFGDRVPPLLAARIDRGLEAVASVEAAGGRPVLVMSGGQGPGEDVPEAEAMARYAVAAGADPTRVLRETSSTTTEENLLLTKALVEEAGAGPSWCVATNDFHAFRAAIIARELGIEAQVVGARTARYFFPSAVLREFVGVLARSPVGHGLTCVVLAVSSGAIAWLAVA
ncbi:YdcF family protein [Phycicoccus sp. CSK15P-2]|uniref:ElyC/SanA/YdcF family protein n=1 Tax=Phycicoccus sp. CSK15P-2 TaxID=2807627 RepID=UPI0019524ECD|nr:ElyC/SanA/YdcF family protein [Phycicoccus sp. CSK15P-2]MBM6402783.1 YdcF family protein [Phycicoccus sp. CSK15P-2]